MASIVNLQRVQYPLSKKDRDERWQSLLDETRRLRDVSLQRYNDQIRYKYAPYENPNYLMIELQKLNSRLGVQPGVQQNNIPSSEPRKDVFDDRSSANASKIDIGKQQIDNAKRISDYYKQHQESSDKKYVSLGNKPTSSKDQVKQQDVQVNPIDPSRVQEVEIKTKQIGESKGVDMSTSNQHAYEIEQKKEGLWDKTKKAFTNVFQGSIDSKPDDGMDIEEEQEESEIDESNPDGMDIEEEKPEEEVKQLKDGDVLVPGQIYGLGKQYRISQGDRYITIKKSDNDSIQITLVPNSNQRINISEFRFMPYDDKNYLLSYSPINGRRNLYRLVSNELYQEHLAKAMDEARKDPNKPSNSITRGFSKLYQNSTPVIDGDGKNWGDYSIYLSETGESVSEPVKSSKISSRLRKKIQKGGKVPKSIMVGPKDTQQSAPSGNDMMNSIAQQLFYLIGKNKTSPLDDNDRNKAIELLTLLHHSNKLNKKEYNSLHKNLIISNKRKRQTKKK